MRYSLSSEALPEEGGTGRMVTLDVEAVQVEVRDHPRLLRLRPRHRHRSPFRAALKFPAASRDSALAFASLFPLSFFSFVSFRFLSRAITAVRLTVGDHMTNIATSSRPRPVRRSHHPPSPSPRLSPSPSLIPSPFSSTPLPPRGGDRTFAAKAGDDLPRRTR
jgi:hypothetical protein